MAVADKETELQLGDFKLLKKLGEGAAGVVYRARQLSFDRDAAVKVLFKHVAAAPKHVERFYREARLAGRLDHPHIVQGYAVGEEHGLHYFAMEYVDGQSVQQWLEQLGRLRLGQALHVTLAVARALGYAHEQDLVHRDVKPGNVLVSCHGEVKVSDLGMAKIRDVDLAELTRTGRGLGTPCYMPMEQFANAKAADARCDIYALGCTLYALLTGQPPFVSPSFMELIQAKEVGTFPPAQKVNPDVPERLDLIIAKMTAKRPDDRYRNCAEVIEVLESLGMGDARLRLERPAKGSAVAAPPGKTSSSLPSPSAPAPVARAAEKSSARQSPSSLNVADTVPETPRVTPPADDLWRMSYQPLGHNQAVHRNFTTAQLLEWICSKDYTPQATARRGAAEKDQPLAAYRELRQAVLDRMPPKTATRPRPAPKTVPEIKPSRSPVAVVPPRKDAAPRNEPPPRRTERATVPVTRSKVSRSRLAWWMAVAAVAGALVYCLVRFLS